MNKYRAAIVGIGGFGSYHVKTMLGLAGEGLLDIVAFAELNIEAHRETYDALTASGAKHYTDYEQMLGEHPEADFVVIATPIAAHKPMCIRALRAGFHVIVEKPPAVTVQDIDEMIAAQRESGRLCQVNFQNTSGAAFRNLLDRLNAGEIGRITHVTGVGMWKRQRSYYERTRWAGKLVCDGQFVLDGTINNPFAHLMHNCLLAAGSGDAAAAAPEWVQAELYHANEIEGDDVSCVRFGTVGGVSVHFYAMLCHERNDAPYISIQGTEGEALWHYDNRFEIRSAGQPEHTFQGESEHLMRNMYLNLFRVLDGSGESLYAPLEACRSFVAVSNGAHESSWAVRAIGEPYVEEREEGATTARSVPGLSEQIRDAAEQRQLFSEYPFPWATSTSPFRMEGYIRFELPKGMA